MIGRTLVAAAALTGIAAGQTYQDGVLMTPANAMAPKAAPTQISSFPNPQGTGYASGIAWHNGELWCGDAFSSLIYRCDDQGNVLGTFNVPSSGVRGIAHDGSSLWVSVWSAKTVYECNPITGAVLSSWVTQFPNSSSHPNGIALDPNGTELIVSDEANTVHWCSKATGAISKSLSLPNMGSFEPRGLALIGTSLFAGYQSAKTVVEYDVNTGATLSSFASPSANTNQQGVGVGIDSNQYTLWLTGSTNAVCAEYGYFGAAGSFWADLGNALPGTTTPNLVGSGDLTGGSQVTISLTNALPNSSAALIVGLSALNLFPFYGGTLVPSPQIVVLGLPTGAGGGFQIPAVVPPALPPGISVYIQYWITDPGGPAGLSASNAITSTST